MTKPFLKWAGGKARLAPEIIAHFPAVFGQYHEPFVGGGAVFFALQPRRAVMSDMNCHLINAYVNVHDNVMGVIGELKKYKGTEEEYYRVRAQDPTEMFSMAAAARFIYLNKTCFNGLYRVNRKGQFNTPFGHRKNPAICDSATLMSASIALRDTYIYHGDFASVSHTARTGDLVYFDPPYDNTFTGYTSGGFGRDKQTELANLFTELAGRGVHVVLSNSDTPFIRELYRDHKITEVQAGRLIGGKSASRAKVTELIITGERSF